MKKPMKCFFSPLSNTFFVSEYYKDDGKFVTITGKKHDITQDIARIFSEYEITFTPRK